MKPSITKVLEHYGAPDIGDYGGWRNIRCPFHDDKHASASVSPDEEAFCCFACDVKGDAVGVVMKAEGISRQEARQKVTEITGTDCANSNEKGGSPLRRSLLPAWTKGRRPRRKVFA